MTTLETSSLNSTFRAEYAAHRAAEGRAHDAASLVQLPYLTTGPLARQWRVRARSFEALMRCVIAPMAMASGAPLDILDIGAGCGWLAHRVALEGHEAVALDIRDDHVDGLGAASTYLERHPTLFTRVVATFDALPIASRTFDVAVFNASIHYALDLGRVLHEAMRVVRSGGRIVILDSPFYASEAEGAAMVAEKRRDAAASFGARAETLLAPAFVEFLTPARLAAAIDSGLGTMPHRWHRHRVSYPFWYELRPAVAWMRRRRTPSRFDLWEHTVS